MKNLFLLSFLYLLFSVLNCSAQGLTCVKGDFVEGMGKPKRLIDAEIGLCHEFKEISDLQEIYGFVISSKIGQIVRIYKDRVVYTEYEDDARYKERVLTDKELRTLRSRLKEAKPETRPPLRARCTDMCLQFDFVGIGRNGGRRVSIFSPRYNPPEPLNELAKFFSELQRSGDFKYHYYIQSKEKQFEVLLISNTLSIVAVWEKGDDFRLLLRDDAQWEKNYSAATEYFDSSSKASNLEDFEARLKRLKRRAEIQNAHYTWRQFDGRKIGGIVPTPEEVPFFEASWRFTAEGYQYRILCISKTDCALVRIGNSTKVEVLRKGGYESSDLVVSPDGRWLVVAKKDEKTGWENLVRVNLLTKEEFTIPLELSYDFDVIAYIAAHNQFLVRQRKWIGEGKDNLFITFLLDAETGKLEKVSGNFRPLIYQSQDRKPLQPSRNPDTFWVAQHDYKGTTQFGIYNTKSFTFQPLATWSDIEFDSDSMWVDEREMKIYFVYRGHLLALPLPKSSSPVTKAHLGPRN